MSSVHLVKQSRYGLNIGFCLCVSGRAYLHFVVRCSYFCLDLGAYTLFDSTDCYCEPDVILYVNSLAADAKKLLYGAIVGAHS